jgi:hypothetical protein
MMPPLIPTPTDTSSSFANDADNADNRLKERNQDAGSQSCRLIELASGIELFHSPDQKPYAHLRVNTHHETYALGGHDFSLYLKKLYYDRFKGAPGEHAVKEAIDALTAAAIFDGPERPVSLRTAEHEGAFYVDLTDADWRAVVITERGWQVVNNPPRFWRTPHSAPLPIPSPGGTLNALRPFPNLVQASPSARFQPACNRFNRKGSEYGDCGNHQHRQPRDPDGSSNAVVDRGRSNSLRQAL